MRFYARASLRCSHVIALLDRRGLLVDGLCGSRIEPATQERRFDLFGR